MRSTTPTPARSACLRCWQLNNKVVNQWNGQFYNNYVLMKLQEGTYTNSASAFNVVTNYFPKAA